MLPARKTVAKERAFPQRKEKKNENKDDKIMLSKHDQKHASRHGYTYTVYCMYMCI